MMTTNRVLSGPIRYLTTPLVSYMAVGDFIDFLNSVALVCKYRIFLFDEASQTHSDVQNEAL